jgi:transcription antitermination factor NusG
MIDGQVAPAGEADGRDTRPDRRIGEARERPASMTDGHTGAPADGHEWYACQTRARSETRVAATLLQRNVPVFLPTVALARRWADRTRTVAFPLFPGYVFARFALTQLHTVISVPGLATVVRFGRRPVPVRAEDIENIRRVAAAFSVIGRKPDPQPFMKGDEVRVVGGPFEGVVGMVVEVRGNRRLLAGIRTIGLSVSIDVDISVLEPTSS